MAANEKFILEFVTKGTDGIDRAKDKIEGVNRAVSGLATALLGVSFASFISGALLAADRISDFSDATNISIASLKALESAMQSAGGNGKNLERAINQLYAAIDTANGGSLQARDAFAAVGVSLSDLKNMSEADILQKTLEGLAALPPGAERSAIATHLLSKSFRSIDPAKLLEALDPAKYAASEEATKRAAEAQQQLEQKYKTLQEGAINALEPILKLMGQTALTTENATKIVQGLGIAFAVLFGAQAIASIGAAVQMISKLTVALKGTAAAQAMVTALGGPKGLAMVAAATVAAGAAIYGLNKILEQTETQGQAASEAVAGVAQAAGAPPGTPPQKIQQATPQAGQANRNQDLDARQRAVLESQRRIAQGQIEIDKYAALRGTSEIEKIQRESAADIAKARLEINAKEHLTQAQKNAEFLARKTELEAKAALDIARVRQDQENMITQQKIGYQDQINQLLGYEKSETQKINDQIAQQPEKYKEIGEQLRRNAEQQDRNLQIIKQLNKEQERYKQLFADGYKIGIDFQKNGEEIFLNEEKLVRLAQARSEVEKSAINDEIDRRKKILDLTSSLLQTEKIRIAAQNDLEGDATPEQIQALVDMAQQLKFVSDLEEQLSQRRIESARRVADVQEAQARRTQLLELNINTARQIALEKQKPQPIELAGMTPLQKQLEEITRSTRQAADEAKRAFANLFTDEGDGLTPEKAAELARGIDEITASYQRLGGAQEEIAKRNYEQTRLFETGWKEAFTKYSEDAFNAADQARTYFDTFTRGFEDAIVRFVQTGKLSFKDLANSLIAEFVRIQAKRLALSLFGGESGGGLFGFLGNIFKAQGGPVAANSPYVVGERGPELFIPRTAGQIVPNNAMAQTGALGGTTAITYNINAVDAASFRSMVARDPQFIYQVTERGRRGVPARSRA